MGVLKKIGKVIGGLIGGVFTATGLYYLYKMFEIFSKIEELGPLAGLIALRFAQQSGIIGGILIIIGLIILWAVKRW